MPRPKSSTSIFLFPLLEFDSIIALGISELTITFMIIIDSNDSVSDGERRAWIGLIDKANEGVFQWSDGTPLTYNNLKQLNTETRDCSTATVVDTFTEEWSMRDCQEESFFICRK